jgi:hypothetical protein
VQGAAEVLAQGFACELLLTNLGKVNVQFTSGSRPCGALRSSWASTVGVTTANDSLCLLHTSFTPIPSLLPRAAEILQMACE